MENTGCISKQEGGLAASTWAANAVRSANSFLMQHQRQEPRNDLDAKIKQMETDALAAFEGSVRQIADVAEELKKARAILARFAP